MAYHQKTKKKCQKSIAPSEMKDTHSYLNTYKLPSKHAFKSPYYEKGRSKSTTEYGQDSRSRKVLDKYALVEEIDEFIQHDKIGAGNKYFKNIKTKQIAKANKIDHTLEKDYSLEEEEIVNVCSAKMFQMKNYYEYMYEKEREQTMERIERRNESLEKIYKMKSSQELQQLNMSEIVQQKAQEKPQQGRLNPHHSRYLNPIQTLYPKENYRVEQMNRISKKYGYA